MSNLQTVEDRKIQSHIATNVDGKRSNNKQIYISKLLQETRIWKKFYQGPQTNEQTEILS